jgi:hypothetical protein
LKNITRATYCFWLIGCGFFILGILLQSNIFCNTDANWLLHATARLLGGGKYYYNFFETNPPMILLINIPPVLLAKVLHLSMASVFRGYVFLIAIFSSTLCAVLVKKIYQQSPAWMWRTFVLAVIFIFMVVPVHAFGEREHIALMLTAPYVFFMVLRVRNLQLPIIFALLIGVLAGIGFAIKPYFIVPFVLVELYLMFKRKCWLAWIRPESLTICGILIIYVISIFVFFSEYVIKVLPLVWKLYFVTVHYPWLAVAFSVWVIFFLISIGYYFAFYDWKSYRDFRTVLLLASIGFICAYFLQHTMWFYHALPSYAFSLLLLVQLLQEMLIQTEIKKIHLFLLVVIILIFAVITPGISFYVALKHDRDIKVTQTINFIRHNASNGKIYVFATTINIPYRFIDQLKVKSVSRFPSQLLLPGLIKQLAAVRTTQQKNLFNRYKHEIIGMVTDDLRLYKPDLIIVDNLLNKFLFPQQKFNYFDFFSQDKEFKRIIASYHYVHRIGHLFFYRWRK